jgi:hypothetical protein
MFRRICWPWCDCHRSRAQRAALRRAIRSIDWVESRGGWIPLSEIQRREGLQAQLDALKGSGVDR